VSPEASNRRASAQPPPGGAPVGRAPARDGDLPGPLVRVLVDQRTGSPSSPTVHLDEGSAHGTPVARHGAVADGADVVVAYDRELGTALPPTDDGVEGQIDRTATETSRPGPAASPSATRKA
jgi:hypothetical protein